MKPDLYFAKLQKTKNKRGVVSGYEVKIDKSGQQVKKPVSFTTAELASMLIRDDNEICQEGVGSDYVEGAVDSFNDLFFLLYYKPDWEPIVAAFIIAREEFGGLHLDVVCSAKRTAGEYNRHSAAFLIDRAVEHAKSRGLRDVTVSAVPSALTYYPKLGFSHRKSCNAPVNVELSERIVQRVARGNLPRNVIAYETDADWRQYMNLLRDRGYGGIVGGFKMRRCINRSEIIANVL